MARDGESTGERTTEPGRRYVDLIEEALAYDPREGTDLETMLSRFADQTAIPFFGSASIAVVEVAPGRDFLHIWAAAGDLKELLSLLLPQIQQYARDEGYKGLSAYGRFGWLKALKEFGAQPKGVYFEFGLGV